MSEVKTVIRIEHPTDGKGLWNSKCDNNKYSDRIDQHSEFKTIRDRHVLSNGFPTYNTDEYLNKHICYEHIKDYYFAFKDLKQLNIALTKEEIKECIEVLGFKVLMIELSDYVESPYQIVFKKESIKSTKDISFMFL